MGLQTNRKLKPALLAGICALLLGATVTSPTKAEETPTTLKMGWAPVSLSVSQVASVNSKNVYEKCTQLKIIESDEFTRLDCGSLRVSSLINTMTPCLVESRVSCIKKVQIQLPNETWQDAEYQGPAGTPSSTWSTATSIDLGPASNGSLFVSRDKRGRATTWHVSASYVLRGSELISGTRSYEIDIKPVRQIPRSECVELWKTFDGFTHTISGGEVSDCYGRLSKPSSFNVRLVLELTREPRGWVTGFVKDFTAEMNSDLRQNDRRLVTIEGKSSVIPIVTLRVDSTEIAKRQKFCAALPDNWDCQMFSKWTSNVLFVTYSSGTANGKPKYLALLNEFPELDTASAEWSSWSMQLNMVQDSTLGDCAAPRGIYGSISSNALMVEDALPLWSPKTQTLEFGVTSPHHRANGDVVAGFYEMQLNEKVAQCLWGTKITPQNVSLSVTDDRGETKVAATTISVQDGMVVFRASGFTYSTTKLRISLKNSERRLSCMRNGETRVQPKGVSTCPKGWRKK